MTLFARCNLSQHNNLSQLSRLHTHGCTFPPSIVLVCNNGRLTRQVCPSDKCIPKARNGSTLTEFLIFAKCPCIKICKTLNIQLILVIFQHWVVLGRLLDQLSQEKCRGNKVILQHGITKNVGHRLLRDNAYRKHLYREIQIPSEGNSHRLKQVLYIIIKTQQIPKYQSTNE